MLYQEYIELFFKKKEADRLYDDALKKKTDLLYLISPHGVIPKEVVNYLAYISPDSKFTRYSAEIDEIETEIEYTKNLLGERIYQLKLKEQELRESKEIHDRIYVYNWLEKYKVKRYYKIIGYSKAQTYRIVDEIRKEIDKIRIMRQNEKN